MKTVCVNAPSKSYEVLIGAGLLSQAGERICALRGKGTVMVVTDSTVDRLYSAPLLGALHAAGCTTEKFVFPAGEGSKTPATLFALLSAMADAHLTRTDTVAALGGGVVGDLAGLAAALYMRGIGLVQLPTTLLAAVDSSVGGKTAIDLPTGKNLAGTFYQPDLVLCDTDTLSSLPPAEFSNGCAEVIKYAVLQDASILSMLRRKDAMEQMIARCVSIKREIVCADERDVGMRQLLNFGHTFAHAIEQCSGYTIPHGSAVAVGMVLVTRAAAAQGLCSREVLTKLQSALAECNLPTNTDFTTDALFSAVLCDKKRTGGQITLVIPRKIGQCELHRVSLAGAKEFLHLGRTEGCL